MLPARICLSLFLSSLFSKNSRKGKNYLLLLLIFSFWSNQAKAQNITPAPDGTGTVVTPEGSRIDITGGTFSRDGKNLFHSFSQFGVQAEQIANFLSNPSIRNILGRVTGGDRSIINGLIQVSGGNSNLYLVNPTGIIFGANAQLNVPASFTATTATGIGFGNNNWLNATGASNYSELVGTPSDFAFNVSVPGSIVNVGNLTVSSGQNLALVGGNVISTGALTAPGGNITIAGVPGSSNVKISQPGHLLSLEIDPSALGPSGINSASLPQLLTGDGGSAATGVTVDSSNQLVLTASGTRVPIDGGAHTPLAIASGSLNVSGATGGTVQVLGDKVGLIGANINASGTAGGGTVLIGGDYQGKGSAINASSTFVSSDSAIDASASQNGNAGRVIVWANETTRFLGNISARGGENSGNGGFVEVSGKNNLEFAGIVDTTATAGEKGTLLLDPKNILIQANGTDPVAGQLFTSIPDGTATISGANLSAAIDLNDVTLQANNDITINDNITATTPGKGLTLQAGRSIILNFNRVIDLKGGSFIAKINDENASPDQRDVGNAQFFMNTGSKILTNGGNVTIAPGAFGGSAIGSVSIFASTINSDSGNISITGTASPGGSDNIGIFLEKGSVLEATGAGNITLIGTGGAGIDDNRGIWLDEGSSVSSVNGNINLTGTGQGTGESNQGIYILDNSAVRSTGRGNISLRGTGSNTGINNNNDGIAMIDGGFVEATATGSITLIGTSGTGGDDNNGINVANTSIKSADGNISLTGIVNGTGSNNIGVSVFNNSAVRSTGKGNITITGQSTATGVQENQGVRVSTFSRVESTGTGNISLTGTAANGLEGIVVKTNSFINQPGTGSKITLTSDEIQFDETSQIRGKGVVQLQPLTPGLGITVGDVTADARLNLDTAKLNRLQNGFSQIIIGRDNGRGAIAINSHSFSDPVKIQSPVGNSTITSTGAIAGTGDASITLLAKTVNVNGTIASPAGITLTADEINLRGGANSVSSNNAIALQPLTPSLNITIGGIGNDASLNLNNIDLAALKDGSNINIGLVNGTGTITVDSTATFNGSVNVVGGSNLVAANRSNTWNITGTNAGNLNYPNGFSFANIENLTGGNLDDTFKVNNGGSISGNINGLNAIDTLDYSAYSSPVTVRLGTGNQVTATGIGGTVINIETLIGGATQNNNLIGANTVNNWNITDTNSGNIGSVNFRGFQNLTGGSNTDNFNLGTGGSVVNINGNAGNNTIIGANINNTWNITGNNTGNLNGANTYANIQTLTGGSETDTFKINNGGFFSGNINGLNGSDALDYSAYSSPVTVTLGTGNQVTATGIGGTVFNIETLIGGTTSNNTVIGANTANNWNITDTNSGNIGSVNFRGFQNLTGGTDTDNFTLSPEGSVVTIDGTAGNNTIIGANINNTWNITGNNTGNLNGANTYSNIQTVIGGSNVDTFKVNNGVNIAGIIDGSAGDDTIDYSANTSPATLTLANLVNIENAIGSAASDTIIATNTANNWNITGTNSGDVKGFKFSDFENLTGGTDTDNFTLGNRGNVSSIDGNAGNNTIIGANKVNTWNITGNNTGNVNDANAYTNIQNLTGGNSNDTFKFNSGAYISGNIDGVNKKDTLDYSAYSSPVEVTLGINNQITATGVGGTILSIENLIGGTSGDNNLIGANTVNSWNITDTNSGNISDITFSGFQKLTGGSDTDNFIVSDRANITGTIIDGSAGNDTIDYSASTSAVTLTLENLVNVENGIGSAADNDTIIATNTANNWNITGTNSGDANGFNFSNFENVTGGNDSDTFTLGTDGSVAKIDGSGGNNTLVGANTVNNWNLEDTNSGNVNDANPFTNIQNLTGGTETDTFKVKEGATIANNIDGNAGTDTLDYSTHSAKITVDMGARKATGVGGTISNIEGKVGGTNTENTLVATDTKNVWNLTSNNSGEVNGVTFSNFQNLTGGKLTDTFKFSDAVQISGIIDGGAGFDDLDYTAYTTPVTVDIPTGTATGTGGIKNIDPLPTSDFSTDLQGETPPPVSVENQPDNTPVLCMDGSLEQQIPETQNLPRCQ
ncbi:filamentous hemagglutinin N-terminal domain-containing protein [Funiculus sociatus GB2-A5]|uniref:Filamentous hemagglutinin N-terminal domain-containing protein n=1 Tax=Funiculus sociatus GB2-A5 TaxID=2933946 RepID=A0ABV0JS16_9CYAN|nr:filamentous hemagglutinin N-terminal domain-containing protein [Trichocoleus sp. FACHB-6]MBD2063351.1 filamentous hemagglutinin N-terminal domain-containing protein [Trichocoleus sp. FACHB-6]